MIRFPGPDALDRHPELAPLAMLAAAALVARSALCSATPGLRDPGHFDPGDAPHDSTLGLAHALVLSAEVIEELANAYRAAALRERPDERGTSYDIGF